MWVVVWCVCARVCAHTLECLPTSIQRLEVSVPVLTSVALFLFISACLRKGFLLTCRVSIAYTSWPVSHWDLPVSTPTLSWQGYRNWQLCFTTIPFPAEVTDGLTTPSFEMWTHFRLEQQVLYPLSHLFAPLIGHWTSLCCTYSFPLIPSAFSSRLSLAQGDAVWHFGTYSALILKAWITGPLCTAPGIHSLTDEWIGPPGSECFMYLVLHKFPHSCWLLSGGEIGKEVEEYVWAFLCC